MKLRCKAVVITKRNALVCARREHEHSDHKSRIGQRPLYNVEEDLGDFIEIKSDDPKLSEYITISHLELDKDKYKIYVPSSELVLSNLK